MIRSLKPSLLKSPSAKAEPVESAELVPGNCVTELKVSWLRKGE